MRCTSVKDIIGEADRILFDELGVLDDSTCEYFFRGESMNFKEKDRGFDLPLSTDFPCSLDRYKEWYQNERELYHEALRFNIVSFEEDKSMVERVARMQHYQMPTRFCDMSTNVLCAAMFACGGGELSAEKRDNHHDGYIRIIKVSRNRMKSCTSDIINAIAHLPLVKCANIHPSKEGGLNYLRYEVTNSRPGFSLDTCESSGMDVAMSAKEQLREEIQHVWAFKPVWNTSRIRSQSGVFLAFGCRDNKEPLSPSFAPDDYDNPDAASCGIAQVAVIQINGEYKAVIREQLRYFGVLQELIYPDLSNVCTEVSDRILKANITQGGL